MHIQADKAVLGEQSVTVFNH